VHLVAALQRCRLSESRSILKKVRRHGHNLWNPFHLCPVLLNLFGEATFFVTVAPSPLQFCVASLGNLCGIGISCLWVLQNISIFGPLQPEKEHAFAA
jgi:hypothetical protein